MVPNRTDARWDKLVDSPESGTYQFLALRILMQRVTLKHKFGMSPAERGELLDEIHAFFVKNERLVGPDLQSIFG